MYFSLMESIREKGILLLRGGSLSASVDQLTTSWWIGYDSKERYFVL